MSIVIKLNTNECPAYRTGRHCKRSFISCSGCPAEHPEQLGATAATIGGGYRNCTTSVNFTGVFSGCCNNSGSAMSAIGGGGCNRVSTFSDCSFIGGGQCNTVCGVFYGTIGGGFHNELHADNTQSVIAGGGFNCVQGSRANISGGACNCVCGFYTAIGGGYCNTAAGVYSFVGGGECNNIVFNGPLYKHSVIAGGYGNTICNSCNFIGGGCNNLVSGAYSAILGGSGNSDGGCSFVGMFGQGLTAGASNTFFVECLNAINTPGVGGWPVGTIYWDSVANINCPGCKILFII